MLSTTIPVGYVMYMTILCNVCLNFCCFVLLTIKLNLIQAVKLLSLQSWVQQEADVENGRTDENCSCNSIMCNVQVLCPLPHP